MAARPARLALLLAVGALLLGACGEEPTIPSFRFQTVLISPTGSFPGGRGASTTFSATVVNNLGEPLSNVAFPWVFTSSDPSVIEIDRTGRATAKSVGTATITAQSGSFEGATQVTVTQLPTALTIVSGDKQSGVVGKTLAASPTVKVVDAGGLPIAGRAVKFSVTSGGGRITPDSVVTGPDGVARTTWTLGTSTAEKQTLSASNEGIITATITATPLADVPTTVMVVGGNAQTGFALERVDSALAVVVADRFGNPVPNVPVTFTVTGGGGSVGTPTAGTNASGRATSTWTLGSLTGTQTATARVGSLTPVAFTATARANAIISGTVTVASGSLAPAALRSSGSGAGRGGFAHLASAIPNDPYYPLQAWHYEMIGLDQAWKLTTGSNTVTVAVLDDGVRYEHANLADNLTRDGYDFVPRDSLRNCAGGNRQRSGDGNGPDSDPTTPSAYAYSPAASCVGTVLNLAGEGVQLAGIVGAATGKNGVVGVSRSVKIRPVRVVDIAGLVADSILARGIRFAAGLPADTGSGGTVTAPSRAPIILVGVALPGTPSAALASAVQAAAAAGSLIIAPAGDAATTDPMYPAAFSDVLSVSAVGPTRALAPYSSYGSTVDLAAPGGDLSSDSTKGVESTVWNFGTNAGSWTADQGTAFAAAHVAGVAALLLAREPGLTAAQLRSRLLDYATSLGDANRYGAGLLNAFASLNRGADFRKDLYVRAVDTTGAIVQTVKAGSGGSYQFSHLPVGTSYRIYAGQDEEGDAVIGTLGRVFGALGGSASPTALSTPSTGTYTASFTIGLPTETGLNVTSSRPDLLTVGGYLNAELKSGEDDWYSLTVPAGTYTLGTAGLGGGCGLALQANTRVDLYNSADALLATSDDGAGFDYCGKVTQTLAAGTYKLRVQGSSSSALRGAAQRTGLYRVFVRKEG